MEEVSRLPMGSAASTLCVALLPLCSSLTSLSTLTLLTLRFDFHCHLFTSLSSIRTSSYNLPTKPTEPEPFIVTLITQLSTYDDTLTRLTSSGVRLYVQRDVMALVAALVVRFVGQLGDRRVTREGVVQLHVDLFALHQLLIGVRVEGGGVGDGGDTAGGKGEAEAFDRCVYYLDLLLLNDEDLMSGDHAQFTRDELKAIQSLHRS